ncbi:hypothetical protein C427_3242 [Paraglaciecola psychrophila 170]|uniref:Uncharacterized protein n=1 Tax=Paraglaciecola psychrophila 170 TaxID=1129794 RepID=K7A6S1_9ALTE|nr:hypothetical protein C427_3242 [Paraglaciecola psychrophila 170]GAC38027.1 hypothetical protein GPSY_2406 [Paraglaciecola psychrophila 170]
MYEVVKHLYLDAIVLSVRLFLLRLVLNITESHVETKVA